MLNVNQTYIIALLPLSSKHFVLTCKLFETERKLFHKKLYEFVLFNEKLSVNDLFTTLMSNTDYNICPLFTKFIYECYEKRKKIAFRDHWNIYHYLNTVLL